MRRSGTSLLSANFQKVVNLAFVVSNLLMIALVLIVLFNIRQQMEDRATIAAQNLAYTLDQPISDVIDRVDTVLALTGDEIGQQLIHDGSIDNQGTGTLLARMRPLLPRGTQLWAVDGQGRLLRDGKLSDVQATGLADIAAGEDFHRLAGDANQGPVLGSMVNNPVNGRQALPLARRISTPDGAFVGTVFAIIALDEFTRKLTEITLGPGDAIELRDARLRLITRYPLVPAGVSEQRGGPLLGLLQAQPDNGSATQDNRIYHYRKLGKHPLYINVGLDQDEFLSPWRKGFMAATTGMIFFLLTSLLVTRMLLRLWTRQNAAVDTLATSKQALLESERRWRKIFDHSPIGAAVVAPDDKLLNVNEALCRLLGYSREELLELNFRNIAHPDELPRETEQMRQLLEGQIEHYANESRYLTKDGQPVWTQVSMSLVRDGEGQPLYFLPMIEDIRTRKEAEAQINYLAFHDALTGLPNRLLAKDRLDHAIAYAAREKNGVGVLHLDLDHFKAINDSLGHPVGDALLKEIAAKLEECVRDTDTICRLGGDEFLIILANVLDPEIISSIAVKVQETLGTTFKVLGHELTTSVSMGITVYPSDGKDFDVLLKKADTALYKAKESGRNTYQFYTEQMNSEAIEYLKIRNGLRLALINEEFLLHYQPQINLADGKVVGVEALIRWRHPELGILQPSRFISIAEDSGLIVPIGDWVLKRACQQAVEWRDAGLPPVVMAVNLSAVQFKRGDIEKSVLLALNESGHDPNYLELELTESILIQDTDRALDTLHRLKAMGMKLSIDDFGTGYSSLSYLKRFNVDKLKIDQSFVRDMANNKNDAAIVQAIIQMARSLNLQVIAEGVEDERLVAMLHYQQCHEAQGYHFARPMAPGAFVDYMNAMAE